MNYTCIILCPLILVTSTDIISHIHSSNIRKVRADAYFDFDKHPNLCRTSDLPKHKIKNNEHTVGMAVQEVMLLNSSLLLVACCWC